MRRRPDGSLIISVVLHVVLGVALLWVLSIPVPFQSLLRQRTATPEERIGYVTLPSGGAATSRPRGGGGRPASPRPPARPLVAPRTVPSTVPSTVPPAAPAPPPAPSPEGRSTPDTGAGGLQKGITPSFADPRVWLPPGAPGTAAPSSPKKLTEELDSVLLAHVRAHQDSMAAIAAHAGRAPGDWTFEKNGKKYGIDRKKIYIGDLSLPTAILALLPLNKGGNPIDVQRERALQFQRSEIMEQAQRAMNEEDFQKAVKQIRERKQREHDAELKRKEEEKKKQGEKTIAEP